MTQQDAMLFNLEKLFVEGDPLGRGQLAIHHWRERFACVIFESLEIIEHQAEMEKCFDLCGGQADWPIWLPILA